MLNMTEDKTSGKYLKEYELETKLTWIWVEIYVSYRFSRVSLKGEPAVTGRPATEEEIRLLHSQVSAIDESIQQDNTTKAEIEKHPLLVTYLEAHTRTRRYMFQIRKCEDAPLDDRLRQKFVDILGYYFRTVETIYLYNFANERN